MQIEQFFPKYPSLYRSNYAALNAYDGAAFDDIIVSKKEFVDLKLARTNKPLTERGEYYDYQTYVARFMSSFTGYDELMLFHEMGTGKTCTAIAAIEKLRYERDSFVKGALVFAKGTGLLKNFVQELLFTCTDGRYVPAEYDRLTDAERAHRTRKITSEFYHFFTFETFAKELTTMSTQAIVTKYNNHIIIIDEVHNLREHDTVTATDDEGDDDRRVRENRRGNQTLNVYAQFHRFCHALKSRKILLMSGTPMKDGPEEIASVMNLMLPLDAQLDTDKRFLEKYFVKDMSALKNENELSNAFRGRISYLKAAASDVEKVFVGSSIGKLRHFVVLPLEMSDIQSTAYVRAYASDARNRNIYTNSRQALLFVFPDGTYGADGFGQRRYVERRETGMARRKIEGVDAAAARPTYRYYLGTDLVRELGSVRTVGVERALDNLRVYSVKYWEIVRHVLANPRGKSFVYCQYVNGSGAILLSLLLEHFGFSSSTGTEQTKARRFALVTNQTSTTKGIQRVINRFNERDNVFGEYVSVLIGSKVINEGFTLKDVQDEFIVTPHWNYGETLQAIARGWRLGSHQYLLEKVQSVSVRVYQMVSLVSNNTDVTKSIDLDMYEISEQKDLAIKQIEHLIKTSAFDCPLAIERNYVPPNFDGQRECDYQACAYTCDGTISNVIDKTTSDIYYSTSTKVYDRLGKYFKTNFYITFDAIVRRFAELSEFEILHSLYAIMLENKPFVNRFGYVCFMRYRADTYYITSDLRNTIGSKHFDDYYSEHIVTNDGDSFEQIIDAMYDRNVPNYVEIMFNESSTINFQYVMTTLPLDVQKTVLEGCVYGQLHDSSRNSKVRDDILNFFNGFYGKKKGRWYVWLYSDTIDSSCLVNETVNEWTPCALPTEERESRVAQLNQSPIGFYGLYNRVLKDFCLKEVTDDNDDNAALTPKHASAASSLSKLDLRKLRVGRRCVDWERHKLINIVSRLMKIQPPDDYLPDESKESLTKLLKTKEATLRRNVFVHPDDYGSKATVRRLLYWLGRTRHDVCDAMKTWFEQNNLLEDSFDCGHQRKRRGKQQ